MPRIQEPESDGQSGSGFEIWFNDLKDEAQRALLRFKELQWPDQGGLCERPLVILSRRSVVDVTEEQSIFCPFCNGTNIETADEGPSDCRCSVEEWLCLDCRRRFVVETRQFITYEEVSRDARRSGGEVLQGQR